MAFTFLKTKGKASEKTQADQANPVYKALLTGLDEMEKQHVDRIVLTLYESEPSQNARGRWLTAGKDTNYYPFEMLDESEQEMIRDGKHYTVVALVRDNIGDIVKYGDSGVELYQRTHIVPFLPALKPESELNYVTEGGAHTGENLRTFAENASGNGWNQEAIEQRVNAGIREYRATTKRLMEKAGVYESLRRMELSK